MVEVHRTFVLPFFLMLIKSIINSFQTGALNIFLMLNEVKL